MKFNVKKAEAVVATPDGGVEVSDPSIQVPGIGVVRLSRCCDKINSLLDTYAQLAEDRNYRNLDALLNGKILIAYVKAVADYERQLEKAAN
jgi:hypothetical protein